ncbi:chemotaxis protein CheW [Bacillus rubiinfantis]|uniref:chemotaxis protein CheW n=1 Tax=Bacillus rubiinfantis TaxID=1499680 RepID=UPI0005AB34B2|nr:chemotaxis protein CheW [Bacillus rubiinfantis]
MSIRKIVAFRLGEEEYGLDIQHVQSIEKIQHITRVPNAPIYVEGVMNLRGNVTPIVDLRRKLQLDSLGHSENTRVIITESDDLVIGFIVDQISDVIDIQEEFIEGTEAISTSEISSNFFDGIAKTAGRLVILLKMEELAKTAKN